MNKTRSKSKSDPLPQRVLIVEDDAVLGLSIEQALEDAGVSDVRICPTTDAALAALRNQAPDAIVLDVHLADRDDGWAIAELVQTLGPQAPRIIFSTGMPQDIPTDIAAQGCVLVKPYDAITLVDLLREPKRRGIISRLRGALS
ncbi:response regulator [Qipengyuania soli]|uniref:Response regulator n=1 Tax=Qipengyuania soli TaxID=2782568 RepID=A0A7S8ITT6_9SPHN|nr:response regulator [Qipengyuania soli]QPC98254.1 response regulator [Qipengyuania soli]